MDWFENSTALCKSVGEVSVMLRMSGAQFDMNHCLLLKTSRIVIDNYVKCLRKNDEEKMRSICFGDQAMIEDAKERMNEVLRKKQIELFRCIRCEFYGESDWIQRFESNVTFV